jgi:hypothetical protein
MLTVIINAFAIDVDLQGPLCAKNKMTFKICFVIEAHDHAHANVAHNHMHAHAHVHVHVCYVE